MKRIFSFGLIPACAWGTVILVLSVLPGKSLPHFSLLDLLSFDKLAHAGVYGILMVLTSLGLTKQYGQKGNRFSLVSIAVVTCSLYGIALELVQELFLTDRYFDIMDIIANIIGCLFGMVVTQLIHSKKTKQHNE